VAKRPQVVSAEDRIALLSDAAVMCRDLRHAWPRKPKEIEELVEMEATVIGAGGKLVEGVRRMMCTGGCGVQRVEKVHRNRHGRLERIGKAQLKYPATGYRLEPAEPGERVEPLDALTMRDAVLRRMFPNLDW